ncbi:MAG: retropepsin-like aspartic protease [Bacteroidota bacterium]
MNLINRYLFCLLIFFAAKTYSQGVPKLNQGGAIIKNYYTEIPYQMINGKILIDVELGGKKHKFIFDTGAPTAIRATLAAQLKATALGKAPVGDLSGKSDSLSLVKVDGLKIGEVTFSGIPCLGSIPDFMDCFGADGFIGSNLLRNSIVGIQIVKHVLVITDQPEKLMLDKQQAAPMVVDSIQSNPQLAVNINGLVGSIPFDTGMKNFMNFREEWMKALQNKNIAFEVTDKGFGSSVIGAFGNQANEEKYLLKFPAVQIGNARFEHVYSETTKDGIPVIGTRLLDYGNIILDYINKQYYFYPRTATIDMEEKHWPFNLTFKDGKLLIAMLWNKGSGLVKLGEQVLTIEGKDYSHVDFCDMATKEYILDGKTTATFVIKGAQGKKRTVLVSKQ